MGPVLTQGIVLYPKPTNLLEKSVVNDHPILLRTRKIFASDIEMSWTFKWLWKYHPEKEVSSLDMKEHLKFRIVTKKKKFHLVSDVII